MGACLLISCTVFSGRPGLATEGDEREGPAARTPVHPLTKLSPVEALFLLTSGNVMWTHTMEKYSAVKRRTFYNLRDDRNGLEGHDAE